MNSPLFGAHPFLPFLGASASHFHQDARWNLLAQGWKALCESLRHILGLEMSLVVSYKVIKLNCLALPIAPNDFGQKCQTRHQEGHPASGTDKTWGKSCFLHQVSSCFIFNDLFCILPPTMLWSQATLQAPALVRALVARSSQARQESIKTNGKRNSKNPPRDHLWCAKNAKLSNKDMACKIHQNTVNVLILYLIYPCPGPSILQPLLQVISQVTVLAPPAMVQGLAFLVAPPGLAEPRRIEPQRMCHLQRWLHSMACQVPQ